MNVIGVVFLAAIGIGEQLQAGRLQNIIVGFGFVGLVFVAGVLLLIPRRQDGSLVEPLNEESSSGTAMQWRLVIIALGLFGMLVAQTWFKVGTAIAGGDIAPPIGTAWIGRIFSTVGWSGSNLGGPVANQGQLPFAVVDEVVHLAGGSGALAQRVWLTLLIGAILVAGPALARSIGMSPLAGAVVGIVFFVNPMTLSQVGINDVYLMAMVLVAALPATLIAYSRGRLKLWHLNLAFAFAAPFVGFSFANPPLVGMLALTLLGTPLLVWARFDRACATKCFKGLLIAGAVMGAASSYWLIPSVFQITQSTATGALSSLSSWGFTESRSTLANGFWLNTTWGWSFSEYYPYADLFRQMPLVVVRSFLPILAFAGLTFTIHEVRDGRVLRSTRLMALLSLLVLGVILLSNGTRTPGFVLFDPLYHLPYGWLLQEPGRFLLVAALGYALLIGLLIDRLRSRFGFRVAGDSHRTILPTYSLPAWGTSLVAIVVALTAGFPLWTGIVVPGPRNGFPSSHVVVPKYWERTASYLNSSQSPPGAVLVLPADDFYQMPYTWYYGNDGFIPNLLDRHVVVPSGQGYDSISGELLNAVQIVDSALISHNWLEASRILEAIGTPIILVRGDINANFPGRTIVSPRALLSALAVDPYMHSVRSFGLLSLYEANRSHYRSPTNFLKVASKTPGLAVLDTLPPRTALVTSKSQMGHGVVVSLPPLQSWRISDHELLAKAILPGVDRVIVHEPQTGSSAFHVKSQLYHGKRRVSVVSIDLPYVSTLLPGGTATSIAWSPVGNCNDVIPTTSETMLGGSMSKTGGPFGSSLLTLHASVDAACRSVRLDWLGGHILLRYWARSLSGYAPQMCLWEAPVDRCAMISSSSSSTVSRRSGWIRYSSIATPSQGTQTLSLFLYAYAPGNGSQSIDQYAKVQVFSVSNTVPPVLLGCARHNQRDRLVVGENGFSSLVVGPLGFKHILVDGLRNGWIGRGKIETDTSPFSFFVVHNDLYTILLLAGAMLALAGVFDKVLWKKKVSRKKWLDG